MYISPEAVTALRKQMDAHSKAATNAEITGDRELFLYQSGCVEGMNRVLSFIGDATDSSKTKLLEALKSITEHFAISGDPTAMHLMQKARTVISENEDKGL